MPDRHGAYEPLAELYERMGLTSEAIAALQTAADGYHKQGKKREALELLRKMATIDPTQHHEPDQGRRAAAPGEAARRRRSPSTSRSPPSSSARATSTPPATCTAACSSSSRSATARSAAFGRVLLRQSKGAGSGERRAPRDRGERRGAGDTTSCWPTRSARSIATTCWPRPTAAGRALLAPRRRRARA